MSVQPYLGPKSIGDRSLGRLFSGPVVVQEKVDGSQFSFQVRETPEGRKFECRSRGAELNVVSPMQMFSAGIAYLQGIADKLRPGFIYRGEYLNAPRHNVLHYGRRPNGFVILFDIEDGNLGQGVYLQPDALAEEAARIGLESVPVLFQGVLDQTKLRDLLARTSVLGGAEIEGVVVKNYAERTPENTVLMGKFVSEKFKEQHVDGYKPKAEKADILTSLLAQYKTTARWQKAVQHLKEQGALAGTTKDIGPLLKELASDIHRECAEEIRAALFAHFWPQVHRGVADGFAQWYKEKLLEEALPTETATETPADEKEAA